MTSKKQPERSLFNEGEQLAILSWLNDPLEKLSAKIDFEIFREPLHKLYKKPEPKSNAGAKPFDYVLMFK